MKFDILKPQSITATGKKAIQEDCMYPAAGEGTIHDKLYVMCDGAGEDGKGYTAAEYFSRTVADYFFQNTCPDEPFADETLREALFAAKEKMEARCPDSPGTAFALFYMHRHGCLAAHVGDCRIYHIRPQKRQLLYRSVDDNRLFSPSDTRLQEPVKAIITDVKYGDYFVMMTKGAHQAFSDREITEIICEPVNDKSKLLRIAKMLGDATENYSVNIIHVSGVMNEAIDESLPQNETVLMENYKEIAADTKVVKPVVENNTAENVAKVVTPVTPAAAKASNPTPKVSEPAKPKENVQQTERPQRSQAGSVVQEPIEQEPEEKPRKKREFPIVTVTALLIVALGVWAWFWGQSKKEEVEKDAPVEVKKKQEKDTFNIIKNEKLHAVQGEEKMKPEEKTEEQKKKEEEAKKQAEKAAEAAKAAENTDGAAPPPPPPTANPAPQGPPPPPVSAPEPAAQPAQNTPPPPPPAPAKDPNTVTPKPVIPDNE